jgi:hypothetical protein
VLVVLVLETLEVGVTEDDETEEVKLGLEGSIGGARTLNNPIVA